MTPYYSDSYCEIWLGDCREVLPSMSSVDLLLTDPPYGIKADNRKRILSRGKLAVPRDYGESNWDSAPADFETLTVARSKATHQIVWGGNYFELPPSSCWLVWDKLNGDNDFADCELAWTNLPIAVRRISHLWNGMIRKGGELRLHPTQKPFEVMSWCFNWVPDCRTVLDPYCGSGTTLVAAKSRGIRAVGVEIDERYCEVAAGRLSQDVLALG